MLAYVCLLAFLGLCGSVELEKVMPSRLEIENSINRTIQEVEKLLQEDPNLPKLSRNDIVDILYNITSTDMSNIQDEALKAIDKTRADYQRALMVVLPYKLEESQENLKELYTKRPIVQMVADETPASRTDSIIQAAYNTANNARQSENLIENRHQFVSAHMRFDDSEKSKTYVRATVAEIPAPTAVNTLSEAKVSSEPQKFSLSLQVGDLKQEASHTSIATKRPIYRGTFSRYRTSTRVPEKLEVIATTQRTKPTTDVKIEATTDATIPTTTDAEIKTTTVLSKLKKNVLSSDQWHYYAPPSTSKPTTTTTTTTTTTPKPVEPVWKRLPPSKGYFPPMVETSDTMPNMDNLKMEDFKKVMEATTTLRPSPIFVTPSATTNQKRVQGSVQKKTTTTTTTTIEPTPMRAEVEQLLNSIGLQPMKVPKPQTEIKFDLNSINALLNAQGTGNEPTIKFKPISSDISTLNKDNSFETPQSTLKFGVKNLSPDMQLLFQQFGLQITGQEKEIVTTTTTTTTTPKPATTTSKINSYTQFKPLPTSQVKDRDFRNFLARFGLGLGESRNQKAMQPRQPQKRPSLIEAVPDNMRKILENIGLIRKPQKVQQETDIESEASTIVEETTPLIEHVFKPHEIITDNKEQTEKIKNLLNTVRMVQEGKADVEDVQRVAHDLLESTKTLENGPDPLKLEEILNNYRDSLKNEVKRQQEKTTTTVLPTTPKIAEATVPSIASTVAPESNTKNDLSPASSSTDEKATVKPGGFFDTFDAEDFLKSQSSTTEAPSTTQKKPGGFFDTFDAQEFLDSQSNSTEATGGAKSNSDTSAKGSSGASISDLEDSFGGSTAAPNPVLPTRPKTGLYFLVDWNSFLEVGEDGEGKEKVELKFAPKVGDPTRFIPVKIP